MKSSTSSSFHEQLRILQSDITTLSNKLSIPGPTMNTHGGDDEYLNIVDKYKQPGSRVDSTTDEGAKKTVAKLKRDLQNALRERDDAIHRLDHAHREMDEMRRALQEAARLRATYDHLRQDHDAVRISLESSERIRKQQKALIDLLQKTASTMSDTASVGSYSSSQYGGGNSIINGSVSTMNSHHGYSGNSQAAENREWLNASPSRNFAQESNIAKKFGAFKMKRGSGGLEVPSTLSTPSRSTRSRQDGSAGSSKIAKEKNSSMQSQKNSSGRLTSGGRPPVAASSPGRRTASSNRSAPSTPLGRRTPATKVYNATPSSTSSSPRPSGRPPRPHSAGPAVRAIASLYGVATRRL